MLGKKKLYIIKNFIMKVHYKANFKSLRGLLANQLHIK